MFSLPVYDLILAESLTRHVGKHHYSQPFGEEKRHRLPPWALAISEIQKGSLARSSQYMWSL
jgi:hypothetical protein